MSQSSSQKKRGSSLSQSTSQKKRSSTSSQSQTANISEDTLLRLTHECVRYLMVLDQKKLPAKRADIIKNVLKEHNKAFNEVMQRAERVCSKVFGFKLMRLAEKGGVYVLVNESPMIPEFWIGKSEEDVAKQGLLFVVLATIFMNDNIIQEEALWRMLRKFDVFPDQRHEVLGEVKKLLTKEFVQQMYLEYKVVSEHDPPTHEFLWGARAIQEVSKAKVLEYVCKVYDNGVKPEEWTSQFQDASETMVSNDNA